MHDCFLLRLSFYGITSVQVSKKRRMPACKKTDGGSRARYNGKRVCQCLDSTVSFKAVKCAVDACRFNCADAKDLRFR